LNFQHKSCQPRALRLQIEILNARAQQCKRVVLPSGFVFA
jgi:hypothetical protein